MACCTDKKLDIQIEDVIPTDKVISPNLREKPLSPILSSLNNRRFVKKLSYKKCSRVKLSNRFRENEKGKELVVSPINVSSQIALDDSLSSSQTKTLIEHLDKLEELENSRNNLYEILTRNNNTNINHVEKLKLPVNVKVNEKENSISSSLKREPNLNIDNECSQELPSNAAVPTSTKGLSVGFQTATGKNISVSDTDIKRYTKIFEDIICPTQQYSEARHNKYAFLRKGESDNIKSVEKSTVNKYQMSKASVSNINSLEKAKQIFAEEEFEDINFNNGHCGFKKASFTIPTCRNLSEEKSIFAPNNSELSLTQVICDSEISNTQMLDAVDNILSAIKYPENNFIGFPECDIKESYTKLQNINKIIANLSFHQFSEKINHKFSVHKNYSYSTEYIPKVNQLHHSSKKRQLCSEQYINNTNCRESMKNESLITNDNFKGFSSASGKVITMSKKSLKNAEAIFNDIDFYPPPKKVKLEIKDVASEENEVSKNLNSLNGFQKASGKPVSVSEISLRKAKTLFDDSDVDIYEKKLYVKPSISKQIPSGNKFEEIRQNSVGTVSSYTKFMKNVCDEGNISNTGLKSVNSNISSLAGFSKASGKVVEVSDISLKKAKKIFDNISIDNSYQNDDQTVVHRVSMEVEDTKNVRTVIQKDSLNSLSVVGEANTSVKFSAQKEKIDLETTPVRTTDSHMFKSSSLCTKSSKKKLGVSHFKPIQICDNKLNKAKLLFDEDFSGISPIKPIHNIPYTSTPIRQKECPIPDRNNFLRINSNIVKTPNITPIKLIVDDEQENIDFTTDSKIVYISPTKDNWMDELEAERKRVESRLNVLLQRERLGQKMMESLNMGKAVEDKKQRQGFLYKMKTSRHKMSLRNFVNNEKPHLINSSNQFPISPKNAENLHFKEQFSESILTEDGAVVIPNSRDMVGLSEIKNAFEVMPGVEPRLIPKEWIKNHFKWIVWKLASYENKFPNYFSGCLNVDNIMQQLKYRYDREIDRAERSALRKICEKDDAPQKRMILFVSDIKKLDMRSYELELCDGWYALRTLIDAPLSNQIINGKIEIGTKLVISGAELLNCDGCHPLEVTNLVCLKINCNSTRRAIWHAKLGFQRYSNPFPIQLQSIYPLGGTIGAIKVCVVRVYPLNYMERLEGRSVWRNRKADEIAAQKWENETSRKLEQIQDEVRKKFENSRKKSMMEDCFSSNISNITCPKTLHEIMKKTNDPESFQENLSGSQRKAILNYQNNLSTKNRAEIVEEVNAGVSRMKLTRRDVTAVMKLLVIDIIENSDKAYNFTIWQPSDAHLQTLKEGKCFTIQNVSPRPNGDLNSTAKTIFKEEETNERCIKYKRRLTQLSELVTTKGVPYFNEFDTVGLVVQIQIQAHIQEVWLTDHEGRLLYITIYEGSETCSLLENLKRGEPTTASNLIFRGLNKNILKAVANHYTVFSSYSQHKHLREGLDMFKKEITKDLQNLLNDCDNKIEIFKIVSDINSFSENFEELDENTLLTSGPSLLT